MRFAPRERLKSGEDMTAQEERLDYLLASLLSEKAEYRDIAVPDSTADKRRLLRSLMNVRPPVSVSDEFLKVQDVYLQTEMAGKGITRLEDLSPSENGIYLWQGDITTLAADAVVNAANSQMLGCFVPCHGCIDNAIHTYAGVQLRLACAAIMKRQRRAEKTGTAKITEAYNLPCRYILHTVGPIVAGKPTLKDERLLASCYRSCLELAEQNGVGSIAFCCISTGEFHFPNKRAAEIALDTVRSHRSAAASKIKVIFNVFKENDYQIYRGLLGEHQ